MNTPMINLSPEARDLLERSLKWLEPAGRWYQGWGVFKKRKQNGGYYEYHIEEKEAFQYSDWKIYEEYSEKRGDEIHPFAKSDISDVTSACALGSLLVNNGGREDSVYEEAKRALADLVIDTKLKEDPGYLRSKGRLDYHTGEWVEIDRLDLLEDEDFTEELIVNFNDAKDTDGTKVKNLFRRVLGRRTY